MYFQRAGRERERAAGEERVQEVREGAVAWQAAAAREMEAQEKEKLREETAARVAQAEAAAARAMEEAEAHAREMAAAKRAAAKRAAALVAVAAREAADAEAAAQRAAQVEGAICPVCNIRMEVPPRMLRRPDDMACGAGVGRFGHCGKTPLRLVPCSIVALHS